MVAYAQHHMPSLALVIAKGPAWTASKVSNVESFKNSISRSKLQRDTRSSQKQKAELRCGLKSLLRGNYGWGQPGQCDDT